MKTQITNIYWDYVPAVATKEACALVDFTNGITAYVVGNSWRAVYHVAMNLVKTNEDCTKVTMLFAMGFNSRVVYNVEG